MERIKEILGSKPFGYCYELDDILFCYRFLEIRPNLIEDYIKSANFINDEGSTSYVVYIDELSSILKYINTELISETGIDDLFYEHNVLFNLTMKNYSNPNRKFPLIFSYIRNEQNPELFDSGILMEDINGESFDVMTYKDVLKCNLKKTIIDLIETMITFNDSGLLYHGDIHKGNLFFELVDDIIEIYFIDFDLTLLNNNRILYKTRPQGSLIHEIYEILNMMDSLVTSLDKEKFEHYLNIILYVRENINLKYLNKYNQKDKLLYLKNNIIKIKE